MIVHMRRTRTAYLALALLLASAACRQQSPERLASRHASHHGAALITEYRWDDRTDTNLAFVHVLFIPDREVLVNGGRGNHSSCCGTSELSTMKFGYYETESGFSVESQPVIIERAEVVKGGGKEFQMARGNLFIAVVRADGALDLSQIERVVSDEKASAESIVALMKSASPGNARLQKLPTTS